MTVCSVTLPSLNYPWQLALMAAMTNSYLDLHTRPVGHKATVQASSAVGGHPHGGWGWPDADKSGQGGGRVDFCHIFADVLYG